MIRKLYIEHYMIDIYIILYYIILYYIILYYIILYYIILYYIYTIFARNYGTVAIISYNLKGIAPPVPPVQCWTDKNLMSGCGMSG
jgi:hypothetical protein